MGANTVLLRTVASNSIVAGFSPTANIRSLALSFDGLRVAVVLSDGRVTLWSGRTSRYIAGLYGYHRRLEFSPGGHTLAFLSRDGGIRLWNGRDGKYIASLKYQSETHVEFLFSRNRSRLASLAETGSERTLTLWNGKNGKFIRATKDVNFLRLAISDDGSSIATGGRNGEVQLWSGDSLSLVGTVDIREQIKFLVFSHDALVIHSSGNITFCDFEARPVVGSLQPPNSRCLALSLDGNKLAGANDDGTVLLWDIKTPRSVTALAFSPGCIRLASGHKDGTVKLWDTGRADSIMATIRLHTQEVTALSFSPDGKQLAFASKGRTVRLWDGGDGASCRIVQRSFDNAPTSIAFSGRLLAVATYHSIVLFDCKSLEFVYAFPQGSNVGLSFSSDESRLASAYNYGSSAYVQVWDTEKFETVAKLNFDSTIERLVLSPRGSRLAITASRHGNGNVQFFDIASRDFMRNPQAAEISWFSPNRLLISQSYDRDHGYCVRGRLSAQDDGVPILWIPRDVEDGGIFTVGLSMYALGSGDGRIVVGQIPSA